MEAYLKLKNFADFEGLLHGESFPENSFDLLGKPLKSWVENLLDQLGVGESPKCRGEVHETAVLEGRVFVAEDAKIGPGVYIQGPTYIGPGTEVRHGAFIRGQVYLGRNCVFGHASEAKGSVFLDGAKAAHFAYVGDSIVGRGANLGAGTRLANFRLDGGQVSYRDPETLQKSSSGLRKFGAILGDRVQTGCNSVLSPGSLLLPDTGVYPCVHFHGTLQTGFKSK